jgi:mono/diheme cytochrome c family protein
MRLMLTLLSAIALITTGASAAEPVDYIRDVKPVLKANCFACHGALKQEAGLRLDAEALIRKGGESGPAVVAGKSGESLLIDAVAGEADFDRMPKEGKPLAPEKIELLRRWIDEGAKAPDEPIPPDARKHWAFQPPVRPAIPMLKGGPASSNPIDAFIAAEQERRGLSPVPPVEKAMLLRRVTIDLIGLPPTRADLHAFLADGSSDAYEKVVDRLLANPKYGERWGRHWMDVWRYSDWDGWQKEIRESQPFIWRWRDWIVESLNADKPYDRMIVEMLAGDEVAPDDPATLRATGFLARNYYKFNRNTWLVDTVEHTSKAFLGLTINCARCHDHKYDPISQRDYYQFRAFFEPHQVRIDRLPGQPDTALNGLARVYDADAKAPTYLYERGDESRPDKEHPLAPAVPSIFAAHLSLAPLDVPPSASYPGIKPFIQDETLDRAQAELKKAQDATSGQSGDEGALAEQNRAVAAAALESITARIAADKAAFANPPATGAKVLAEAAAQAERQLAIRQAERNLLEAEQQAAAARQSLKPNDAPSKAKLDEAEKKLTTSRDAREKAAAALAKTSADYSPLSARYPTTSTGRRLALARWITARDNPLAARVAVNHIWLRHFGVPLVPTEHDFGLNGQPPTHPELLEWLAIGLMDGGWQMKRLHRMVVTSAAYRRQSSDAQATPRDREVDPENRYLWRMNSRRMEAEAVRDSVLAVAGSLDAALGGPDLDPEQALTVSRRSIYFRIAKEKKVPFLAAFDGPNVLECYRRTESVVPQQALALANSSLSIAQSRLLAKSLSTEVGGAKQESDEAFIAAAFEQVLSRGPTTEESTECAAFLRAQTELFAKRETLDPFSSGAAASIKPATDPHQRARENLIHVLFNHNEFLTIR